MRTTRLSLFASCLVAVLSTSAAQANETSWHKITVELKAPALRTLDELEASASTHASPRPRTVPFQPTMGTKAYLGAKAAANRPAPPEAGLRLQMGSFGAITSAAQPVPFSSFAGVDQATAGNFNPPDTHGAIGINYFVEVTNSHLDIYTRSGFRVKSTSLNNFFQYFTQPFFDPRAIYDAIFDRWVILAPARAESATVQRVYFAASANDDPLGTWYVWNLNVMGQPGDLFDYPQLGVHSQALIFTANIFDASRAYRGVNVYTIPINYLYSGANPLVMAIFPLIPTGGTLAPPIVLDTHPSAFLVSAPQSGSTLGLYRLSNLLIPNQTTLTGPTNVSVPTYNVPPDADQPAPCAGSLLDTLDSRFVNASTQVGDSLWQVHTILVSTPHGNRPRPRYYQIHTVINSVIESGTFSGAARSYDFNASIAATDAGDVYVNWSSTDPSRGVNAQVQVSGRSASDPWGVIPTGFPVVTSSTCKSGGGRWGDYSAVTVDPTNSLNAWVVNEMINSATQWGSRIGRIIF